jgi:preprotein translocase subunit SecE
VQGRNDEAAGRRQRGCARQLIRTEVRQAKFFVNDLTKIGIWVAVIGVIFVIAWRKGLLLRLSNYVGQTKEELRKCTWPTVDELKGSTVLVAISIAILGLFTFLIDRVFFAVVLWISKV